MDVSYRPEMSKPGRPVQGLVIETLYGCRQSVALSGFLRCSAQRCTRVGNLQACGKCRRLRLPSPSIRSWEMMGCGREASSRGGCPDGESRFLFTSPVRSLMAWSRAWLSWSNWLQTVLISTLSRFNRPGSLFNFWAMSSTSTYSMSADAAGEAGGDCGTGPFVFYSVPLLVVISYGSF